MRANRVTVQTTEQGYEARFYRTHRLIASVSSQDTEWKADEGANSTTNRESFRAWVIAHSEEWDVEWNPDQQKQAWERKYNTYLTDEQVAEDAITLVEDAIYRLADKSRYCMVINSIEVSAITPKDSPLAYVEDGRYTKSGAWCVADIELELDVIVGNLPSIRMVYHMEMKSGQICKPKTTIAEWNEMVAREMELNGIEDMTDTKTA